MNLISFDSIRIWERKGRRGNDVRIGIFSIFAMSLESVYIKRYLPVLKFLITDTFCFCHIQNPCQNLRIDLDPLGDNFTRRIQTQGEITRGLLCNVGGFEARQMSSLPHKSYFIS